MTSIAPVVFVSHLRAEPNEFILHYRGGRLARSGAGLAFWFLPLRAAIAMLPVQDVETTFVLTERTADYQDIGVQCTLVYRVVAPEIAATRVNFTLSLISGAWVEQPLERLASFWSQRARRPARTYLASAPLVDAVGRGAEVIRASIEDALRADLTIAEMGLALVSVNVQRVAPAADVDKALQTPIRESIQQKADQAVFARRAEAVENERAIKQNELSTEIELARRQEDLIRREGANRILETEAQAAADQVRTTAELAHAALVAEAYARDQHTRVAADAESRRLLGQADAEAEAARVAVWQTAPTRVLLGLAAQQFASKIESINHLNISPDLLASTLQVFLRDQADAQAAA
jgi:regulator of protease activity HflC (stomatin/prohibitin superfamily)